MAKKRAYQTYYRDKNGELKVQLVDAETGQPVTDKSNYNVVDSTEDQGVELTGGPVTEDAADAGNKPAPKSTIDESKVKRFAEGSNRGKKSKGTVSGDETNNFGFIDKPGWAKYAATAAGLVGGPLVGAAVKGVDLGINASNVSKINKAREHLGLPPMSTKEALKGTIKGVDDGSLGNIDIGKKSYGVSINDAVIDGKTQLTVPEARVRSALAKSQQKVYDHLVKQGFEAKSKIHPELSPNVPGTETPDVSYNMGPKRPGAPEKSFVDTIHEAAVKSFGAGTKVNITSGQHKHGKQFGSNRHNDPTTMDFQITRPDGTIVKADDPDTMNFAETAKTMGVIGTGFGTNYMGGNTFHFDEHMADPGQANQWANVASQPQNVAALESAGYFGATTKERSLPHNIPGVRPTTAPAAIDKEFDVSNATPAQMAARGLIQRTPEQKAQIAYALAGELGPEARAALAADDPRAKAEFANMITSVENRLGKIGDLDSVLDPSQYNSLMPENLATTTAAFKQDQNAITSNLESFYSGGLQPTDWGIDSYYNPDVTTPNWSNETFGVMGQHTFGKVANWQKYSEDFYSSREAIAQAAKSMTGIAQAVPAVSGVESIGNAATSATTGVSGPNAAASYASEAAKAARSLSGANRPATGMSKNSTNFGREDSPSSGRPSSSSFGSSNSGGSKSFGGYGANRAGTSTGGYDKGGNFSGKSYSGKSTGLNSPSEGAGRFGGTGLGTPSKDNSKSQGPSGGGYGGWGGPR